MISSTATMVFTIGQTFIGRIDVRAPVSEVHIAITTSIPAEALYTTAETGAYEPPKTVTISVSKPMKHSATPSATHFIAIIRGLSLDIPPKPLTTDFIGTIWAMPHTKIIAEPTYNRTSTFYSLL